MFLYGLDSPWMSQPVYQLCRMEQEYGQQGTCMVWHLWGFLLYATEWSETLTQLTFLPYLEATRITIGLSIAIPAASLCITRHLYQITCLQSINVSKVGGFGMLIRMLCLTIGPAETSHNHHRRSHRVRSSPARNNFLYVLMISCFWNVYSRASPAR